MLKSCEHCNKLYEAIRTNQKYCSTECSKLHFAYIPQVIKDKECEVCGKSFKPKTKTNKYCSKSCSQIEQDKKYEETRKIKVFDIFKRDEFTCAYCGRSSFKDKIKLVIDHIYPINKGGGYDLFNSITVCESCNSSKTDRLLSEDTMLKLWQEVEKRNNLLDPKSYEELTLFFKEITLGRKSPSRWVG